MAIKTTAEAVEVVRTEAPASLGLRIMDECPVGEGIRQGDLYLIRINPTGETTWEMGNGQPITVDADKYVSKGDAQLAPGNTQGSRHIIADESLMHVKICRCLSERNPILGDIIHAEKAWRVNHPEHDPFMMPAGSYIVAYQLDWKTKRRVHD